jgi:hypothetical protein
MIDLTLKRLAKTSPTQRTSRTRPPRPTPA